ncbi:aminotransferase class I/II-fold pyridoxal phosphate-dependent enzyme, partial [Escherichia sp. HC-CC]
QFVVRIDLVDDVVNIGGHVFVEVVGSALINDKRARTAQTPGGTGALRVAADFLAKNTSVKRVWVSNPSWPNHKSVFNSAGLEVREYAYYDAENHTLDFDALINSLNEAQAGDVVLFHGCCHKPTSAYLRPANARRVLLPV